MTACPLRPKPARTLQPETTPVADQLRVIEPGLFSSVQDFGRFGYQRYGISASGAMDNVAMRVANRLCGNPPEVAVVEMTLIGAVLVVEAETCRVAVVGGDFPLLINDQPAAGSRAHDVSRGD